MTSDSVRLFCIVPAYRAAATVCGVVASALEHADAVVVVDDACPQQSGALVRDAFAGNPNVHVVERQSNGGVGAAVKTGIAFAIDRDADAVVKIDADAQMDPAFLPVIRTLFDSDPALVCVKGNRFFDSGVLRAMPKIRLFGNAVLSLCAKFASGYWNVIDPTNGYLAFNLDLLRLLPWNGFADRYFFELSVLCELGLRRLPIVELQMPTIYNAVPSSLSIRRVALEFPPKLLRATLRRIGLQYFLYDVNLATLYVAVGVPLLLFGLVFGGYEWTMSEITGISRETGTVILAAVTFLMGFQLLLNALVYDVSFAAKTTRELLVDTHRRLRGATSQKR